MKPVVNDHHHKISIEFEFEAFFLGPALIAYGLDNEEAVRMWTLWSKIWHDDKIKYVGMVELPCRGEISALLSDLVFYVLTCVK